MNKYERKMMAFLAGCLYKIITNQSLDTNELQQLENIKAELGYYLLDENEFRY